MMEYMLNRRFLCVFIYLLLFFLLSAALLEGQEGKKKIQD